MPNDNIRMPVDGVGKAVRTNSRTVGSTLVHEHYFIYADAENKSVGVSVNASPTVMTLLASNTLRKGMLVSNMSGATLCVRYGSSASTTLFDVPILPRWHWEMQKPISGATITGIWYSGATVVGSAKVREFY